MNNWPQRLRRRLTFRGIPAARRHVYVVTGMFLITATVDNALDFRPKTAGASISGTVDELVQLEQMAETACSLYH